MRAAWLFWIPLVLVSPGAEAKPISIQGPRILLSDLLPQNPNAAQVDLGPAPAPGQRRRLHRQQLSTLTAGLLGRLPRVIEVQTRSQRLDCGQLRHLVTQALADQSLLRPGLELRHLNCPAALVLPFGSLAVSVRLPAGVQRAGVLALPLELHVGDWPARSLVVTAQVDGDLPVLVAARQLNAGTPLAPQSVRVETRQASTLPSDAVFEARQLTGKKLVGPVSAGEVIRQGNLTAVPVVRRNTPVTILATLDGLRVTSRGVAREDGAPGELVSVLSPSSGRLIKATVVGPNRVVVGL